MIKDIAASVKARLLNFSKMQGRMFDEVLTMYMLERLLYRLSCSDYQKNFILKGGLFLCVLFQEPYRTTKDIDLLGRQLASKMDDIEDVFRKICKIAVDDGLVFLEESIHTLKIKEDADYEGVRVLIECRLGQSKKILQIDIGFGDVIVPKAIRIDYPTILEMEFPNILVYSVESVIAEKFDAMIKLSMLNSRMKDFYDVYMLTEKYNFEGRVLYEAIFETFQRRGTAYERNPDVFMEKFSQADDKRKQWIAFMRRTNSLYLTFEDVMNRIRYFLYPIFESLLQGNEFFLFWDKNKKEWEKKIK